MWVRVMREVGVMGGSMICSRFIMFFVIKVFVRLLVHGFH